MIWEYRYEEIEAGMEERFQVEITAEKMELFRQITGDINPLHCDREFAQSKGYRDCVVYGMLTSSFYSTLAGVYLPGRNCLLHSVETKLLNPVFVGDFLTVVGRVEEKEELFHQLKIKAEIWNQKGEKVSRAIIKAGVIQ